MKPSFATPSDLADWLGEAIEGDAETKRAELTLRAVSAAVRSETQKSWVDEIGALLPNLPDELSLVTLMAAGRFFSNPDDIEDISEGVDDWNVRERRRTQGVGISLTNTEKDMLANIAMSKAHRGLSVVSTTRGDFGHCDHFPAVNGNWPCNAC